RESAWINTPAGCALTPCPSASATARWCSSAGAAWIEEATMDMATIAAMEIAVIFGFEFMILAGPFCISLFSQCLYKQGIFQCCRAIVEGRIIDASIKFIFFW